MSNGQPSDQTQRIDSLLIQGVVLLNRQCLLIKQLVKSGELVLRNFENAIAENKQSLEHVLEVYNYVLSLIDHIERFRKVAFNLPKLNHRDKEYRALQSAIGAFEDIRHKIQHINNEIENDYTGPLLGAVWWVNGNRQYNACFHDIGRERSSPGIVFGPDGKALQRFCYVYNETYYDLDKAVEAAQVFDCFLAEKVQIQIDGRPYKVEEHFAAFCMELKISYSDQT